MEMYESAKAHYAGESQLMIALHYWQDLLNLAQNQRCSPIPKETMLRLSKVWAEMATDLENDKQVIDEMRGFAQAFGAIAGFDLELSCCSQDAFEWIKP